MNNGHFPHGKGKQHLVQSRYLREERLRDAHQTVQQVFEGEADVVGGHAGEAGDMSRHHRADVALRGQRLLSVPGLLGRAGEGQTTTEPM